MANLYTKYTKEVKHKAYFKERWELDQWKNSMVPKEASCTINVVPSMGLELIWTTFETIWDRNHSHAP